MRLLLVLLVSAVGLVAGHGYLNQPASRNILANRKGKENCPHCLPAGGPGVVGKKAGGVFPSGHDAAFEEQRHGMCGDAVDATSPKYNPYNEAIDTSAITVYKTGASVTFEVVVTTHHFGHFEFFLCDTKDLRNANTVTQECLFKHILQRDPNNQGSGDNYSPIDPNYPERYYMIPKCLGSNGGNPSGQIHKVSYLLPQGLECSHCIIQWWWATANSCAPPGYDKYSWPANPSGCSWNNPSVTSCGGGAYPEEFWNCADVQITASGTGTGIPAPPPMEAWEENILSEINKVRTGVKALPENTRFTWSAADATDASQKLAACTTNKAMGELAAKGTPTSVVAAWAAEGSDYTAKDGSCSGAHGCTAFRQITANAARSVGCAQGSGCVVCKFEGLAPASGPVFELGSGKACKSKQAHIADSWCVTVGCSSDYAAYCHWVGDEPAPSPSPPSPTPPSPTPPSPTPPSPTPPSPTPPSPPNTNDCTTHKARCQTLCNAHFGGVKTNQCWGAPDTYVQCMCSDLTELRLPEAPACRHSSCPCIMK